MNKKNIAKVFDVIMHLSQIIGIILFSHYIINLLTKIFGELGGVMLFTSSYVTMYLIYYYQEQLAIMYAIHFVESNPVNIDNVLKRNSMFNPFNDISLKYNSIETYIFFLISKSKKASEAIIRNGNYQSDAILVYLNSKRINLIAWEDYINIDMMKYIYNAAKDVKFLSKKNREFLISKGVIEE